MKKNLVKFLSLIVVFQLGMIFQCWITPPMRHTIQNTTTPVFVDRERVVVKEVPATAYIVTQDDMKRLMAKSVPISQGINPKHVKRVVESTLIYLGVPTKEIPKWTELLLITAQVESDMGWLLKQQKGPAQGIFQMEPPTERFLRKYLESRPELLKKVKRLRCEAHLGIPELQYNMSYAAAMTYVYYKQRGVNPAKMSSYDMVVAHKRHYNTDAGKASVKGSLKKLAGSKLISLN